MVARALWRSEALRVVPYGSCRVSDQGTTLRASDLHNARATILNTFIPTWISNYIHYKVWDEVIYPFLKRSGATLEF